MERQKSFSIKTTRFLAISSSVIFLIFLSIWVINTTPSVHQETHYHFNKPTLSLGVKPSTVHTSTTLGRNFTTNEDSNPILIDTHFRRPENRSGFANVSRFEGLPKESETEVSGDEKDEDDAVNSNLTGAGANFSARGETNSILLDTHFRKPENTSGFAKDSISKRVHIHRMENEFGMFDGDVVNGNLTTREQNVLDTSPEKLEVSNSKRIKEKNSRICDVTKGRWVFDESLPMYTNGSCPVIDEGFNCEGNGRLDKEYMKWRWQPQDCEIPRFNATKMLKMIRGKRLVFVGDSINRNQWESMLCLLMGAIKDPKRVCETHGQRITKEKGDYSFKFVDYKCTIEYYVTHFLVRESKARVGKKRVQTLRIDAVDKGSSRWKGADILVFNTAHWWTHYKTKAGISIHMMIGFTLMQDQLYQEGDQVHPHLDVLTAFRKALITWASWVDEHINPGKTQVFFRSLSPSHFRGGQWNSGGRCTEATQPLHETSTVNDPKKNCIVKEVIKQMKTPVTILNVTSVTEYRIDGHPSVYGRKFGKSYSLSVQDCSHWCLPGVPDTWNELLYFHLQKKRDFVE